MEGGGTPPPGTFREDPIIVVYDCKNYEKMRSRGGERGEGGDHFPFFFQTGTITKDYETIRPQGVERYLRIFRGRYCFPDVSRFPDTLHYPVTNDYYGWGRILY